VTSSTSAASVGPAPAVAVRAWTNSWCVDLVKGSCIPLKGFMVLLQSVPADQLCSQLSKLDQVPSSWCCSIPYGGHHHALHSPRIFSWSHPGKPLITWCLLVTCLNNIGRLETDHIVRSSVAVFIKAEVLLYLIQILSNTHTSIQRVIDHVERQEAGHVKVCRPIIGIHSTAYWEIGVDKAGALSSRPLEVMGTVTHMHAALQDQTASSSWPGPHR
jgi:hypothetical protein